MTSIRYPWKTIQLESFYLRRLSSAPPAAPLMALSPTSPSPRTIPVTTLAAAPTPAPVSVPVTLLLFSLRVALTAAPVAAPLTVLPTTEPFSSG